MFLTVDERTDKKLLMITNPSKAVYDNVPEHKSKELPFCKDYLGQKVWT